MTESAVDWYDLADELKAKQLAELAALDVENPSAAEHDAGVLAAARRFAGHNLLSAIHADVAPPDEATACHDWVDDGGIVQRYFVGRVWSTRVATCRSAGTNMPTEPSPTAISSSRFRRRRSTPMRYANALGRG